MANSFYHVLVFPMGFSHSTPKLLFAAFIQKRAQMRSSLYSCEKDIPLISASGCRCFVRFPVFGNFAIKLFDICTGPEINREAACGSLVLGNGFPPMRDNARCLSSFIGQFLPAVREATQSTGTPRVRLIRSNTRLAAINLNDDYGPFLIFNDSFCLMDLCLTGAA